MNTFYQTIKTGTKYLSEIMDDLPHNAYINKGVTGCGGTTLALTNDKPYVIAVHSKSMVENKTSQHKEVFGVTGDVSDEQIFESLLKNTKKYIVTYDSLPRLCKFINPANFHLLVDEVQVLIRYAGVFKIKVCNDLLNRTHTFKSVSYMTATPTPIKYLPESIQELDYVEYKWEDAVKPIVRHKYVGNLFNTKVVTYILDKYTNTNTDIFVFYNSINGVITTIKKLLKADSSINLEDINIFFAENKKNTDIFTKNLGKSFKYASTSNNCMKRINFVSSMGFEGIDFYNNNVSILVASDSKYKSMRYDISIDIPQIVGRFRNSPTTPIDFIWSSYTDESKMTEEEFLTYISERTASMKEAIDIVNDTKNVDLAKGLKLNIATNELPYGYIDDTDNTIKLNEYAFCSLMSSYSAMHCDYFVLKRDDMDINDVGVIKRANDIFSLEHDTLVLPELNLTHQKNLDKVFSFTKLAKQYCQLMSELDNCSDIVLRKELIENINNIINCSENLQKYHGVLNHTNITSSAYNMKKLDEMYNSKVILQCLGSNPLKLENNKIYEVSFIKKKLLEIYIDNGINKTPNTKDLKFWYDVSVTTLKNVNNIIVSGFRITNIK